MTPENGGKIELKLSQTGGDRAEYAVLLQTAEHRWRASVWVGASLGKSQVEFGPWVGEAPGEPPAWLTEDARAALKAALRTSQAGGPWPRRLARWRPAPAE